MCSGEGAEEPRDAGWRTALSIRAGRLAGATHGGIEAR